MPPINASDTCNNASHLTVRGIHNASDNSQKHYQCLRQSSEALSMPPTVKTYALSVSHSKFGHCNCLHFNHQILII